MAVNSDSSDDKENGVIDYKIVCDGWGRMKKVKIARSVNEEMTVHNFMIYKYILCKHPQSCLKYIVNGSLTNFLKGFFISGYACLLIGILTS